MSDNKRGPYEKPFHLDMPFGEALNRFAMTDPNEASGSESDGPVHLFEDATTGDRFLIYGTERGVRVELRYDGDTLWMTQAQIANLFGVERSVVTKHLANIYEEGELDPSATSAKIALVRREGARDVTRHIDHYNLDAVISVGYRVSSKQATLFRRWATSKLVQFATKGFVIDAERLKEPGNQDRIAELRETIRDIRAAEANVYAELRRICAMCQDYDPKSEAAREFYGRMQAKLFWAVTNRTPSMLMRERLSADKPNMGLQTWDKAEITQLDATTAKNALGPTEIRELNRLTTILLDIFEDQTDIGRLTLMSEATALMDAQLRNLNRQVLNHGGNVSRDDAIAHAKAVYKRFDAARRAKRAADQLAELAALKAADRTLPKPTRGRKKAQ
jgi:hypothetical protein